MVKLIYSVLCFPQPFLMNSLSQAKRAVNQVTAAELWAWLEVGYSISLAF